MNGGMTRGISGKSVSWPVEREPGELIQISIVMAWQTGGAWSKGQLVFSGDEVRPPLCSCS